MWMSSIWNVVNITKTFFTMVIFFIQFFYYVLENKIIFLFF